MNFAVWTRASRAHNIVRTTVAPPFALLRHWTFKSFIALSCTLYYIPSAERGRCRRLPSVRKIRLKLILLPLLLSLLLLLLLFNVDRKTVSVVANTTTMEHNSNRNRVSTCSGKPQKKKKRP